MSYFYKGLIVVNASDVSYCTRQNPKLFLEEPDPDSFSLAVVAAFKNQLHPIHSAVSARFTPRILQNPHFRTFPDLQGHLRVTQSSYSDTNPRATRR